MAADKLPGPRPRDAAFLSSQTNDGGPSIRSHPAQVGGLLYAIKSGKASMMALEEAAF